MSASPFAGYPASALDEAVGLVRLVGGRLIAAHCDQRFRGSAGNWSVDAGEDDSKKRIPRQVAELDTRRPCECAGVGGPLELALHTAAGEAVDGVSPTVGWTVGA